MIFVDAGMVGNYSNAQIIVRTTSSSSITGITNAQGNYTTDQSPLTLNATQGLRIVIVLAWSTRILQVEAVPSNDTSQPYSNSDSR